MLSGFLKTVSPIAANVLIGAWLLFALWSHLARGVSTFFVCMDRFARQSLRPREYWEGVLVGGLLFAALGTVVLGYAFGTGAAGFAALACLFAAVANAAAFTNDHHLGRHIYNLAAGVAAFGAVYAVADIFLDLDLPYAPTLGLAAIFTGVAVSWLRPFRVLYA